MDYHYGFTWVINPPATRAKEDPKIILDYHLQAPEENILEDALTMQIHGTRFILKHGFRTI